MLNPPILLDMIQINEPPRIRIAMRRRENTPPPQLQRLLLSQIIPILRIQHAVRKRLAGPDAEQIPRQPRAVRVDVVERGPFLRRDAGAHGAHGQAHAFVRVHEVREDLGRRGDGDAAFVAELVQPALHAEVGEPVLAVLETRATVRTLVKRTESLFLQVLLGLRSSEHEADNPWCGIGKGEIDVRQLHRPWSRAGSC